MVERAQRVCKTISLGGCPLDRRCMHPPLSVTASAYVSLPCQFHHPCNVLRCLHQLYQCPADGHPVSVTTPREGRGRPARIAPGSCPAVSTYQHIAYRKHICENIFNVSGPSPKGGREIIPYVYARMGGPQNIVALGYSFLISLPLQSREKCSRICSSTRTSCFVVHTATDRILSVSLQCTGRIQSFLN